MSKTKEPRRKKNRNDEGNRDDYHILKNEVWNILFFLVSYVFMDKENYC